MKEKVNKGFTLYKTAIYRIISSGKKWIESISSNPIRVITQLLLNIRFIYKYRGLKHRRKIIYALTPPSYLKNIGDHAQVIAIRAWFKKHFPEFPVIEINKDESRYFLPALKWLVQPTDVLFLQSGGNLGDRGIWSESRRRLLISAFTDNQIISLPQTIYFSDTPIGKKERENTRQIYAIHPHLTLIARDRRSEEIAKELFPKAKIFCMPDFALSLNPCESHKYKTNNPPKVLLCLRDDNESILTEEQKKEIAKRLPYECIYYNTVTVKPIELIEQEAVVRQTFDLFCASDAVITDRLHGLIFALICQKPCVALPSIDHKITAGMEWFKNIPFVTLARDLKEIPSLVEKCLLAKNRELPDWNAEYFDNLPKMIDIK